MRFSIAFALFGGALLAVGCNHTPAGRAPNDGGSGGNTDGGLGLGDSGAPGPDAGIFAGGGSVFLADDGGLDCTPSPRWVRLPLADAGLSGTVCGLASQDGGLFLLYSGGYAYRSAQGSWTRGGGPTNSFSTGVCSIAIAPNGRPHIAYEDIGSQLLIYWHETTPGVWPSVTVASNLPLVNWPSIAVDPLGNAQIAYAASDGGLLDAYAAADGGWVSEPINGLPFTTGYAGQIEQVLRIDTNSRTVACHNIRDQTFGVSGVGCEIRIDAGVWQDMGRVGRLSSGVEEPWAEFDSAGRLVVTAFHYGLSAPGLPRVDFQAMAPAGNGGFAVSPWNASIVGETGTDFYLPEVFEDAAGNAHLGFEETTQQLATDRALLDVRVAPDGSLAGDVVACHTLPQLWKMTMTSLEGPVFVYSDRSLNLYLARPGP